MIGNKFLSVAGAPEPTDAQFNYVTMLLHGDGTNGAQNNTFLDSSSNAFTITRNGNTTQGSFSPYGSGWSNSFDGASTTKLTLPSSASFVLATNDFCIEAWVCGTPKAGYPRVVSFGPYYNDYNSTGIIFYDDSYSGYPSFYMNTARLMVGTSVLPTNQWTHIAVTRSGTTFRMFINGTQVATATSTASASNVTSIPVYVGNVDSTVYTGPITGNISNLRIVNGSAVYTSNFTPSTTPLTSITNTVLLTCQSNRFVDNSANAFAITPSSGTSVQRFNPFGTSTAYSTATIGGSGYFDGTGDYLKAANNTALQIGSSDFTIECWYYSTVAAGDVLWSKAANGSAYTGYYMNVQGGGRTPVFYATATGSSWAVALASSITLKLNSWNHIAVTRSGSTWTVWVNGVSGGTATSSATILDDGSAFTIGALADATSPITGYVSDLRFVKGTALYTSAFTPPTAPLTAVSNTQLLTNFTNGAIYDNAMINDLETVGNAQISTSVKKYGTGSMSFDGSTGSYLLTNSQQVAMGTGDFTVECWVYISSLPGAEVGFVSSMHGSGNGFLLDLAGGGGVNKPQFAIGTWSSGSNPYVISPSNFPTSQWVHVAGVRYNGTIYLYINGTSVGTPTSATADVSKTAMVVGRCFPDNAYGGLNGYIDDLRITKGYARYTANFTPPTAALADKSSS